MTTLSEWRRSTRCDTASCVEVAAPPPLWRKSTRSSECYNCVEVAYAKSTRSNWAGECVEVGRCDCADQPGGPRVMVRDSKDKDGPVLSFAPQRWAEFIDGVRAGQFG